MTKFGKVSVFSDLNNLEDISRNPYYADICGISEEELLKNFSEDIQELASANGQTFDQACERLRTDYDGYHFCPGGIGIYNPFSLLNTFKSRQYGSYWFETGTPTYLVELLKKHKYDLYTKVEYRTSQGRIDLVLQTSGYVYIMEFKLDGSAEQAIAQIEEKQYALPFAKYSRKVYIIGVNFSSGTRNIDRWIVKKL